MNVVFKRVLAGVIEVLDDSRGSENLAIIIEAIKNNMDSLKWVGIVNVSMNQVAKLNKITNSMNHFY